MDQYCTPKSGSPPYKMPDGSFVLKVQRLKVVGPENDPMGNIRLMVYSVLSTIGAVYPKVVPYKGELKTHLGNRNRGYFLCKKQGNEYAVLDEVAAVE